MSTSEQHTLKQSKIRYTELMLAGAIGVIVVPKEFFGIPERFSVFAATIFTAILGVYLFKGFEDKQIAKAVC